MGLFKTRLDQNDKKQEVIYVSDIIKCAHTLVENNITTDNKL